MAEIVVGLLGPLFELGKCMVTPVKRQFIYLCCFNKNVLSLSEEAKKLEDERAGLQMEVDTAKNNAQVIDAKVESWFKEVNEIQQKMSGLETEITKAQGGRCLSVKPRYSTSRRVVKAAEAMKQKREDRRDIAVVSHRPQPASMVPDILERPTSEFESRTKIEEDTMAVLKDENVYMMGMCGMGGVGKTTLAEKIKNRVINENVFGESVMVVVSQPADKQKIQGEIAEKLGLKLKETSLSGRAERLCTRLMGGKRILIVLDDVWEHLDLKELGIPCKSGPDGCTILLTSRNRSVLARMNARPICVIETLTKREAWSLFEEKLGTCADDQNQFSNLAQEIANECKGLPLALVSVAGALKDEKNVSVWKDALVQLRSSNPEDLSDVLKDVYAPIKLSYDYLSSQNARSVFLLCCLFPEDFNIPLEDLFAYAVGLRMFEGIRKLEQARDRTVSLVEMLKSRFMLLEGRYEGYVKMHDVVRDVAIYIASKEKWLIKCGDNSTWISPFLGERIDLSKGSTFPNLRLLMIKESGDEKLEISGISFEGMKGLNVLSITYNYSFTSLPHTTQFLKNLHTLNLRRCKSLKTLCAVGELINLEILTCSNCDAIEELPLETARLKCLRLLEISNCRALQKIRPGVISNLDKLEELKMESSFKKWEAHNEEIENENVCLGELESLSNLTRLEIQVKDSNLVAQQISLPRKIEKYNIVIGSDTRWAYSGLEEFRKFMFLHLPREITLGNWIHEYLASVECLFLRGNGSNSLDLREAQCIRRLDFQSCSTASSVVRCGATNIFPLLESMSLSGLYNLEEMCDIDDPTSSSSSSSNDSFKNLKKLHLSSLPALNRLWKTSPGIVSLYNNLSSIVVVHCKRLVNLAPLSATRGCLSQLESLSISYCDMMEQVFSWNEENEKDNGQESRHITITFPKLKILELKELKNLKVFYQGIESIEFPLLTRIEIKLCQQLEVFVPNTRGICIGHDNHSSHVLCKEKVSLVKENIIDTLCAQIPIGSFTHLEDLTIDTCPSIKSLFSFSIARNLESLKLLRISKCKKMEKVIEEDEESTLVFPHLENLTFRSLPKLKIFCNSALGLPKLVKIDIYECPEFSGFNLGSLTENLESLQKLSIGCCSMEQVFLCKEQENAGQDHMITFLKLTHLSLFVLTRLTTFCKGVETIEFPLLNWMCIETCPNMKTLFSTTTCSSSGEINNQLLNEAFGHVKDDGKSKAQTTYHSWPILEQIPIGNFTRLELLHISDYDEITSFLSSSIATNLINLTNLKVGKCKNMVKVIEDEVEEYSQETTLLFPRLKSMFFDELPNLKFFCEWRCALIFPLLEEMTIDFGCPKMERFSLGSLSTPNLKSIRIERVAITVAGDLNDVLQQRFVKLKLKMRVDTRQEGEIETK